jgi:hypothetical protein
MSVANARANSKELRGGPPIFESERSRPEDLWFRPDVFAEAVRSMNRINA